MHLKNLRGDMSNCYMGRYKRNNKIIAAWETHSTGVAVSNFINLTACSYGRIECGRSLVQIPSRVKDYKICICCFFDKHTALSSKINYKKQNIASFIYKQNIASYIYKQNRTTYIYKQSITSYIYTQNKLHL